MKTVSCITILQPTNSCWRRSKTIILNLYKRVFSVKYKLNEEDFNNTNEFPFQSYELYSL